VTEIVPLEVKFPRLVEVADFELTLTYDDVAGKRWRSTAEWDAIPGRYEKIVIGPLDAE
jgi:hypothetical protein